jgi:RNA polymerase sigma-70 factor, ECF subfamily
MMNGTSDDTNDLLGRAQAGDEAALNELFSRHRARLRRMVEMRLDWRLQARLDASDVLQDAYLQVSQRWQAYFQKPAMPFFLWLRLVVGEQLVLLHRQHLGTKKRDAGREISLFREAFPAATSAALAAQLLGKQTSPTQAVARAERMLRVQEAVNALSPMDREIISLRHFEHLSRQETAQVLGIEEAAASKRYIRALQKLKKILTDLPGGLDGI